MSKIAPELQSLKKKVTELKLLPGNPRRGDIEVVRQSLERFGQRKPLTALPDGTVTAGNHTLQAAMLLGWTEVAVVTIDDDPATAKAWALADNRVSDMSTNDDEDLAAMLAELVAADSLDGTGYSESDHDDLLKLLELASEADFAPDGSSIVSQDMEEAVGVWEDSPVRMVVLSFQAEIYDEMLRLLINGRSKYGVESNTDLVQFLLEIHCDG